MKVKIRDREMLSKISPSQLVAYLEARGWRRERLFENKGGLWRLGLANGEQFEILVPLQATLRDYVARLIDAIDTLEVVEERSQLEIFRDLTSEKGLG